MSGLSELSSSTRASTTTVASASRAEPIRAGIVDEVSTNIEPNKMVNDAPVVELYLVPRYRKSAARPRAAPSTTPVVTSRPRRRWMPIISMNAAAPARAPPDHGGAGRRGDVGALRPDPVRLDRSAPRRVP